MIPRKEAKRLLEEFIRRLSVGIPAGKGPNEVKDEMLADSDQVLRGVENVEQKARRYLIEGRLLIERVDPGGLIVATARGSGTEYKLGWDPNAREWRCTCQAGKSRSRCSHVAALQLMTVRST